MKHLLILTIIFCFLCQTRKDKMKVDTEHIISQLDEPCRNLLEEVSKHVTINFELREDGEQLCDYINTERNDQAIPIEGRLRFYEPLAKEKIAHELLHAKCGYLLGDDRHLFNTIKKMNPITQVILNKNICNSIINQTEHYIFYRDYVNMGYTPKLFVEGVCFDKRGWEIFNKNWKMKVNENGVTGIYNLICVLHHILLFPIDNRFRSIEKELKRMNGQLYTIFKEFACSISNVHLEKNKLQPLEQNYEQLSTNIDQWLQNNNIVIINTDNQILRCTRETL